MLKDLINDKRVVTGAIGLACVSVLGVYFLNQRPETSEMNEIKTEQSDKPSDKDIKAEEDKLIFDENSEATSDGTPIIQGDYKVEDALKIADIKAFQSDGNKYQPSREDAELQVRLNKHPEVVEDANTEARLGDTVIISIDAKENGNRIPELIQYNKKMVLGSDEANKEPVFQEMAIGAKKEQIVTKEVTYPADDINPLLAGKTITYELTMTQIARPADPTPEEVDKVYQALVSNSEYSNKYKDVAAAKIYLREHSEVIAYPAKLIAKLQKEYENFFFQDKYESEEEFFTKTKANKNQYYAGRSEYVRSKMKDELLLEALSAQTGVTMDSEEFKSVSTDLFTDDQKRDLLFELVLSKLL